MAIFPFLLLLLLLPTVAAQWQSCGNSGNYKSNSTYETNFKLLSSTLPKKAASNATLFATDTVGDGPDTVFALALCRGDQNAYACEVCLATAFQNGPQVCPYNKDVSMYYDPCLLRFSNKNFLATTVDDPDRMLTLINDLNIRTSVDTFNLFLSTLINNTAQSAVNSSRRFTTSRLDVSSLPMLYCLMQCRPDLTAGDCADCLQVVSGYTLQNMKGKQGGRVAGTRCNMRYEIYSFFIGEPMLRIISNTTLGSTPVIVYGSPPVAPAAAPPPDRVREQRGRTSPRRALWIIAAVAAPLLLCFISSAVWMRR
ncbi:hypothetical protein ACQ4PT_037438 [Festuca glaucescens]